MDIMTGFESVLQRQVSSVQDFFRTEPQVGENRLSANFFSQPQGRCWDSNPQGA